MCKRLLCLASFALVLGLAFAGGTKAADPNLVGWWPLDEGAGETVVDLSGSGGDGTIINPNGGMGPDGSVWVEDPERGIVLSFNGVNGTGACVTTGVTIPAMDLTTDFTWMFWCKQDASQGFTSATGGNDVILGNRYGGTAAPLQFVKFTPTNFEFYNGDNTNFITYPEVMPSSVWVHNVTVKDGDKLTYYRDGFEVRSITLTKTVDANPFYMGADGFNGVQEAWCGYLSDVRIYNRAVTRLDILAVIAGVEQIDMEVGFAMVPPVMDGEVDAIWSVASTQSFVPLADPANASGTWKVLYDMENLYVLLDVTDDSLQNDSEAAWQDDSVEVYFDGGNTKLSTPLSGDDHQYTFGWTADDVQGTNITGYTEGIEQAQVTTDTGWRIEIKLPWLSIQGLAPQAGDLIGIDCYYNDDDDGGDTREGKMLSFSATEGWNDASQWATAILAVPPTPTDPGAEGLVAYYPLDADAGDASGNGLDGAVMGETQPTDGASGGAMLFDGDGDYIEVAHNALLDITGPISLSLWIRPDAEDPEGKGTETAPMAKAGSTASPPWSWQVRYGWGSPKPYMAFTFNTSPRAWAYVNQNLAQGEWHHIACSADGQTLTAYLNGLATESTPMGAITSSPTPVLIGTDGWSCDWIGAIDEVAIYNRALSAEEMLYLAGFRVDAEEEEEEEVVVE